MVIDPVFGVPLFVTVMVDALIVVGFTGSENPNTMRLFTGMSEDPFEGLTVTVGETVSADPAVIKDPLKGKSSGIPSELLISLVIYRV
jgi:hypothetical protein